MKKSIQTSLKDKASSTSRDVVGLEIGAKLAQGTPVVRMHITKQQTELLAAGFVKLDDYIPLSAETAEMQIPHWSLPKEFQASKAAIAVTSPLATLRQTVASERDSETAVKLRTRALKTDKNHPPIVSSMPDFVAAWLAGRFQEGHRPTTRSIQTSMTAALNCFLTGPVMQNNDKTALVVFCHQKHSSIVVFFEGNLMLYREHPIGYVTLRESISAKMNIDLEIVDSIMDDPAIDISSIIEPSLSSLFRQVDISADYLLRRQNCAIHDFYLYGVPSGVKHWTTTFQKFTRKSIFHLHPFGGISCANKRLRLPDSFEKDAPLFMSAIGAARALLEDL